MKARMTKLLEEYGSVALTTYLVIWVAVLAAFAVALQAGIEVKSAAGTTGLLAGAWVATKLTQPLRILATLALTPFVAALWRKLRPAAAAKPPMGAPVTPERPGEEHP